jgi:hypothetical protein
MSHVSSGTGPTGVSACMITATENNAQGGLNTQFFRAERVLEGHPYRITFSLCMVRAPSPHPPRTVVSLRADEALHLTRRTMAGFRPERRRTSREIP